MATCVVSGILKDPSETAIAGATVRFNVQGPILDNTGSILLGPKEVSTSTASDGTWSLTCSQACTGLISIDCPPDGVNGTQRYEFSVAIPASSTATFPTVWLDPSTATAISPPNRLPQGQIWIGNIANLPSPQTVSGDGTISVTGVLVLTPTGTAGTYTQVTTDAQGRVTTGANPPPVRTDTIFTTSGTWVCPTGLTSATVWLRPGASGGGGGGAGGRGFVGSSGGGGGGGGAGGAGSAADLVSFPVALVPGATYAVTVGAGGVGGTGSTGSGDANSGELGGNTSFVGLGLNLIAQPFSSFQGGVAGNDGNNGAATGAAAGGSAGAADAIGWGPVSGLATALGSVTSISSNGGNGGAPSSDGSSAANASYPTVYFLSPPTVGEFPTPGARGSGGAHSGTNGGGGGGGGAGGSTLAYEGSFFGLSVPTGSNGGNGGGGGVVAGSINGAAGTSGTAGTRGRGGAGGGGGGGGASHATTAGTGGLGGDGSPGSDGLVVISY